MSKLLISPLLFAEIFGIWIFILAALIVIIILVVMHATSKNLKERSKKFEEADEREAIKKILAK